MVIVLSVFNGFRDLAASRLSLLDPEILVTPVHGTSIDQISKLVSKLESLPEIGAAREVVEGEGLATFDGQQLPVRFKGVPGNYEATSRVDEAIIDGVRLDSGSYITLGAGIAVAFDARPGTERPMIVSTPRRTARINPALPIGAFVTDTFRVSGVFSTQQSDADGQLLYLPIDYARHLMEYSPTLATAIELAPSPGTSSEDAIEAVKNLLGPDFKVSSRMEQEETSLRMINVEKWITFTLLLFILAMASFNILSTMAMMVIEKRPATWLLSALGAAPAAIRKIFFTQGCLIAFIGGVIGIIIGACLCLIQQHTGFVQMGGDHNQMSITAYPVALRWADLGLVALVIVAVGIIAGTISSRHS